ncbi:MAG: FAD-dependent oxidoreductase [Acholeplasmatales bacterium]|nr:FAD-dependent oxidoreductase [Acholeplasmatales bacterium]
MKKIVIIGGGLSGLAAGIYALKAGFSVTIVEKNNEIGGLCTTWYKDGIMIDGCVHWITGSSRGNMLPIYKEVGMLDDVKIYKPPFFYKYIYNDVVIEVSRDASKLKEQLFSFVNDSNDKSSLNLFFKLLKRFKNVPFHTGKPVSCLKKTEVVGYIKNIAPMALAWNKTINMSILDFANSFNSDVLKHFFLSFMPSYYSLTYFVGIISQFITDNADTIYCRSLDLSLNMKKKFKELGGNLILNEEITKLNIENNSIVNIESLNKKYEADYYINASPLHYFYEKLLDKQYHDKYVDYIFDDIINYPLISTVYIAMKIDKEYKEPIDHFTLIHYEEGITVGSSKNQTLHYRAYPYLKNNDGSTTLICLIDLHVKDYDVFKEKYENGTYYEYKEELGNLAMNVYINKFPKVKDYISLVDVASPLSFEKKTYTYKGAYLSSLATPFGERKSFEIKDKFISNLYHAGQWITQIGGIPRSLSNGKFAIDEIVHQMELMNNNKNNMK